jgi:hypothetical protein
MVRAQRSASSTSRNRNRASTSITAAGSPPDSPHPAHASGSRQEQRRHGASRTAGTVGRECSWRFAAIDHARCKAPQDGLRAARVRRRKDDISANTTATPRRSLSIPEPCRGRRLSPGKALRTRRAATGRRLCGSVTKNEESGQKELANPIRSAYNPPPRRGAADEAATREEKGRSGEVEDSFCDAAKAGHRKTDQPTLWPRWPDPLEEVFGTPIAALK